MEYNAEDKVWFETVDGIYYEWECKECAMCEDRHKCELEERFLRCSVWEEKVSAMYEIIRTNCLTEVKALTANQLKALMQTDPAILGYRKI